MQRLHSAVGPRSTWWGRWPRALLAILRTMPEMSPWIKSVLTVAADEAFRRAERGAVLVGPKAEDGGVGALVAASRIGGLTP